MVNDSSFLALLDQIRCDHGINVTSTVDLSGGGNDTTMRFALNRSNVDSMAPAREQISDFLTSHKVLVFVIGLWTVILTWDADSNLF